jgi:hypothetical protein
VTKEVTTMDQRTDQWMKAPYAILGAGEAAVEKTAQFYAKASTLGRKVRRTDIGELYKGLASRGEAMVKRIQRSKPAQRAAEGSKEATRQLKGAVTSVRKAVGMEDDTSSRKAG